MQSSVNGQRRRLLLGAAMLAGTGAVVGLARTWAAASPDSKTPRAAGLVTIVAFDAHGKRLGKRTLAQVVKSAAQWQAALSPMQYHVLRESGTERAFTGQYVDKPDQAGIYRCRGCGNALYDAATQFHSGTGWPSFWQPIAAINITEHVDLTFGMTRTGIRCTLCDGHLGHKFHDGPEPTGLRYCMNSVALAFAPHAVGTEAA